ncbi:ABC transporter substrate-binding protein [Cytobacillus dafuensis]|uniref:ABC transporter substrate-binding protein n=1 Tax=Cytobacillus dafuensis TaxID=1742359 RepID=A0A5B8Z811_CYTDA|nr:ABC transporter substrate-binding protein [Cytobacillus dafuensis]QED49114.1 ABC transporter substrate-binding protein [Cytobacillus dafuensis]
MKRIMFLMLVTVMFISIVGCTDSSSSNTQSSTNESSEKKNEKTAVIALGSDPVHFNPNVGDGGSGYVTSNVLSSLITQDDGFNILPDLAESWDISEDGKIYTFHLQKDVKWHDGEPFKSKDVKWTIDEIIEKKGFIVNQLGSIKEITCPDDQTVVIELKEPNAAILSILSGAVIMPSHLYEGTDWVENSVNQHPIGTGPFKFVEHKRGISVTLEANKDYFKGAPKIDKLVFSVIPDENTVVQSFLNGEVDVIDYSSAITPAAVPSLEKTEGVKVVKTLSNSRQYMIANLEKKPWNDVRVREALAYAIDRDELVKKAHKGYAWRAEGFYTPAVEWAYNDKDVMPERDVEKAKQLLDEAGLTPDKNGVRLKDIEILIFQFPVFTDIAKVVQSNLKEIGIETTISTLEYSAWDEKVRNGDFELTILGGNHGIDPEGLFVRVGTGGAMNLMHYSNPEIDRLLAEGLKTADQDERAVIYKEIQKIMSEEYPVLPLTEWMYIFVMKDYISGHPIDDGIGKVGGAEYSILDVNK